MSLVVARRLGGMVYLVADTFLTDPTRAVPRSLLQGVIKTRVIADDLAISFAGSIRWVETAFARLEQLSPLAPDEAVETLLRVHNDSAGAAEFIVASASPPALVAVKDGSATPTRASWLGSEAAFERFQGYATGAIKAPPGLPNTFTLGIQRLPELLDGSVPAQAAGRVYSTLLTAMRLVIEDESLPEVGGFVVPVGLHKGRFTFMDYAAVVTHPLRFDLMPKSFSLPFGTAAEGGHAVNLMSERTSSTKGLALYVLQARSGAAFVPQDGLLRPVVVRDKSPIEFEEALAAQFGLDMGTFYGQPREYCERAMRRLHEGDLDGALAEAEKAVARSDKDAAGFDCRGIVRASLGRLAEAIDDYSRALAIDATNFRTWANRGLARGRAGDARGAMDDLDHAIRLNPDYPFGYRARAMAWRAFGDEAQALRDEATAERLDRERT